VPLITIFLAAFFVMLGFFVLALQLFVALIAFKLGSLAAFVALPWGVFSGTAWVAERPLGWVVGSAIRLFVLALIASVSITFVASLPATFSLDAGGALNVLLFGVTMLMLSWFGPQLASEVVSGQPHLSGSDAVRAAQGAAASAMGLAVTTRILSSGMGPKGGGARGSGRGTSGAPSPAVDHSKMTPRPRNPPTTPPSGGGGARA
jgi:type IV secretion system protein TrbL